MWKIWIWLLFLYNILETIDFENDYKKYRNDVFEEITTRPPTANYDYRDIMDNNSMFVY